VVAWSSSFGTLPTISGITDNAGNAYLEAGNARAVDTIANQMVDIWYTINTNAGATALTINPNPSGNNGGAVIWEFSGIDPVSPLDQAAVSNTQPPTVAPMGASVNTTAPAGLVLSVMVPGGSLTGLHAGSPFINDFNFFGVGWAHLITSNAGTYAAQWDTAAATYTSSTVAFRASNSTSTNPSNACDLATPYGPVDNSDVLAATNMSLGITPCTANVIGPGVCNVVLVQRVINASLGGGCLVGTPAASHSVSLNWVASTSSNVIGYRVYRAGSSGGSYTLLSSNVTTTNFSDTNVQSGLTYFYVVTAVDTNGLESAYSNQTQASIP
jgi:hypothetical protein